MYIAGANESLDATPANDPADFRDDLKFAESAAAMLGNLRVIKQLERGNAALGQFFSPPVLELLEVSDPDVVLAPRECEISVLFCDLRGFSIHSERSADDLFGLLDDVSDALGIMTKHILNNGGVVGDFQGDSVMGFWGWPLEQPRTAVLACKTSLEIFRDFESNATQSDPKFEIGIGIATGTAVAGKIGTVDQFKVTVFGPVVNLASRLESMTRQWGAQILIDKATEHSLLSHDQSEFETRPLGLVQPVGMSQAVNISQLIPPSEIQPSQSKSPDDWLQSFRNGDWKHAKELLDSASNEDRVARRVLDFIAKHESSQGECPPDWDGIMRMTKK